DRIALRSGKRAIACAQHDAYRSRIIGVRPRVSRSEVRDAVPVEVPHGYGHRIGPGSVAGSREKAQQGTLLERLDHRPIRAPARTMAVASQAIPKEHDEPPAEREFGGESYLDGIPASFRS